MSEANLNETVTVLVQDASVITVPIDDTLSNSGEAADAKAVGDALALKADASAVTGITVNGESADAQGHIVIDGADIKVDATAASPVTIKAQLEALDGKTAETIIYETPGEGETAETIAGHVDGVVSSLNSRIDAIGTIETGTSITTTVASGGWTDVASVTLDPGVWIITGGMEFPSFAEVAVASLWEGTTTQIPGSTIRGVGTATKAFCVTAIESLESETTITLRASQSSGSNKTISKLGLKAIRIA